MTQLAEKAPPGTLQGMVVPLPLKALVQLADSRRFCQPKGSCRVCKRMGA